MMLLNDRALNNVCWLWTTSTHFVISHVSFCVFFFPLMICLCFSFSSKHIHTSFILTSWFSIFFNSPHVWCSLGKSLSFKDSGNEPPLCHQYMLCKSLLLLFTCTFNCSTSLVHWYWYSWIKGIYLWISSNYHIYQRVAFK